MRDSNKGSAADVGTNYKEHILTAPQRLHRGSRDESSTQQHRAIVGMSQPVREQTPHPVDRIKKKEALPTSGHLVKNQLIPLQLQ